MSKQSLMYFSLGLACYICSSCSPVQELYFPATFTSEKQPSLYSATIKGGTLEVSYYDLINGTPTSTMKFKMPADSVRPVPLPPPPPPPPGYHFLRSGPTKFVFDAKNPELMRANSRSESTKYTQTEGVDFIIVEKLILEGPKAIYSREMVPVEEIEIATNRNN